MEIGRNPVSEHQIQPECKDEQANAVRDCLTRLARSNSQARTGTGKYLFFAVRLTTSRIGNLTQLILTLPICDNHPYIHYSEQDWLTSCKIAELASRQTFVRREPGRDGKTLSDHRQDGNDEVHWFK